MWPFSSGRSNEAQAPAASAAPAPEPTGPAAAGEYAPQATYTVDAAQAPSAADILGGGNYAVDLTKMYPMAGLGKDDLEFLDIVDDAPSTLDPTALPSRGWSDNLSYGTGTAFLGGQLLGVVLGTREGLMRPLGVEHPTARLRLNAVLNAVSRRGSFLGNSGGVLALIYTGYDAIIDAQRGKHDIWGAMASGALTGATFKITAGPRPVVIASGLMAAAAGSWTLAKRNLL